ncbi:MAG: hypothetical protein QM488_16860 [Rhizobiaceae bacterium]
MSKTIEGNWRVFADTKRAGISVATNATGQVFRRNVLPVKLCMVVPVFLAFFLGFSSVVFAAGPSIRMSKTSVPASVSAIGEVISYTIVVLNDGDVLATDLLVTNSLAPPVCASSGSDLITAIAPGGSEICAVSYTVTTTDFALAGANDGGSADGDIDNVAGVSGTAGSANVSDYDIFSVALVINPQLQITKLANLNDEMTGNGLGEVGETITYTFTVENIGNVPIANVRVNDTHAGSGPVLIPDGETLMTDKLPRLDSTDSGNNGIWESIGPGDIVTFTATYTITQTDVDTLQ